METPEVSVVLPCYRGAEIARRTVERLTPYLAASFGSHEIVVVDDGGGDFDSSWPAAGPVRLIRLPVNRGKGAAVRAGMLASRGRVRVFTDVDLPYDLDLIAAAAHFIRDLGYHLAVGDRTLPGASYAREVGWRRRLASAVFSRLVATSLTGGFFDTQCGFKAFRDDVAEALFGLSKVDRFAFDVEILYLALLYRTDIKRIPVQLRSHETSVVRLLSDSLVMILDVGRVRLRAWRGAYRSPELAAIVGGDFAAVRAKVGGEPSDPDSRAGAAAHRARAGR